MTFAFPPPPSEATGAADRTGCPICGSDRCECHLPPSSNGNRAAPHAPATPRLRAMAAADVIGLPRPVEILEGVLYADCLTVLAAESGTGKTFTVTDMAGAVADGTWWHGRAVRHGSVVYTLFEGDAFPLRLAALRDVAGRHLDDLYLIQADAPLSPQSGRDQELRSPGELDLCDALTALADDLARRGRPPIGLLVIDTVRQSMTGSEDSSEHVSAYLRSVRRVMATVPGAACLLVHHSGWQDGEAPRRRERGSSAWRGNSDVTLYLEAGDYDQRRGEMSLTLRTLKIRDQERPAPLHLVRRRVELAESVGGDLRRGPVTSCVIGHDERSPDERAAAQTQVREAAERTTDLQVLRTIAARPELTSQDRIRLALGWRREAVQGALGRLLARDWITLPPKQRQPYVVTSEGLTALADPSPL